MLRPLTLTLITTCLLFVAAPPARADTIILTSGSIRGDAFGIDNAYFADFAGEGFSFRQRGEAYVSNLNNASLTPGETVTSSARFFLSTVGSFGSTVTFNGVTYTDLRPSGELTVAPITLTVPPADIRNSEVVAPFSLAGTIIFSDVNGPLFSVDVAGSGLATFVFDPSVSSGPGPRVGVVFVTYSFAPAAVPEPATLLLLGTGLAGVAAKARRRRKGDKGEVM